ncbi:MAG: hypothetical protein Q8N23_32665 [Archangium sp.]|nr:hypothetical protein [Archangium sp.]MDP3157467.1 hypothetical protein [Archangium sp.]
MVPVRIGVAPWARKPTETRRSGLLICFELAGGVTGDASRGLGGPYSPAASALLTVGYAWW